MEVIDTSVSGYSVLEAALGIGAVFGGLVVGRWDSFLSKGHMILAGIVAMAITCAYMAFFSDLRLAAGVVALGGAGEMLQPH